jgi:hypothetical protein
VARRDDRLALVYGERLGLVDAPATERDHLLGSGPCPSKNCPWQVSRSPSLRAPALDLAPRRYGVAEELIPGDGHLLDGARLGDGLAVGADLVGELLGSLGVQPSSRRSSPRGRARVACTCRRARRTASPGSPCILSFRSSRRRPYRPSRRPRSRCKPPPGGSSPKCCASRRRSWSSRRYIRIGGPTR